MSKIRIIAEIGINHNGCLKDAKTLIDQAIDAGVWGIKFQYRSLKGFFNPEISDIGGEIVNDALKKNSISSDQIVELCNYIKTRSNLSCGISFFREKDLDDFEDHSNFDFYKVPSSELLNKPLVRCLSLTGKPIFISLGMHCEKEIESAIDYINSLGVEWIPFHCISNYPLEMHNSKLGYLKTIKKKYKEIVGYSSHDRLWENCIIAMSFGAKYIERHITLSKKAKGLDHSSSSSFKEFKKLVEIGESFNLITQNYDERFVNQGELLNRKSLGGSFYTNKNIRSGDILSKEMLSYRSPKLGIDYANIDKYIGKSLVKDIPANSAILPDFFDNENIKLTHDEVRYCNEHSISIPARPHDLDELYNQLPLDNIEFHLSYGDLLSEFNFERILPNKRYSIHLPDYTGPDSLIDILDSRDKLSKVIIRQAELWSSKISELTNHNVPIITSIPYTKLESKEVFYEKLRDFIEIKKSKNFLYLPQWLPKYGWYFGGSVSINLFNDLDDLDFILEHKIDICMDTSHLLMSAHALSYKAVEVLDKVVDRIKHIHISEAIGVDNEGLIFGKGSEESHQIISNALNIDVVKVIEVWDSHLNNFKIAKDAIRELNKIYA